MLPALLFFSLVGVASADSEQIPSTWSNPNITDSVADRISIAKGAIDEGVSQFNATWQQFSSDWYNYGDAATLFSQMAEFDLATNQTVYEADLINLWATAEVTVNGPDLGRVNFTGTYEYGHAAAMAYKTYKNPIFLSYAEAAWWAATAYTISTSQIENAATSVKAYTLSQECTGITMAGGTFYSKSTTDGTIDTIATGGYLGLSALLAELTSNSLYLNAATQSLNFMHNHLYNAQSLVQDSIAVNASQGCSTNSLVLPDNSGLMLEGVAVLYSITGNSSLQELASDIIAAALSTTKWQSSNGIITPGDLFLPRGLIAVYTRNIISTSMMSYVAGYLGVQYNALTTLSRSSGGNIYGNFAGPAPPGFISGNQTNAIGALLAAISITNSSSISFPSPTPTSTSTPTSIPNKTTHHSLSTGTIAGLAIAGLAMIALVFALLFFLHLRQRKKKAQLVLGNSDSKQLSPGLENQSQNITTPLMAPGSFFKGSSSTGEQPSSYIGNRSSTFASNLAVFPREPHASGSEGNRNMMPLLPLRSTGEKRHSVVQAAPTQVSEAAGHVVTDANNALANSQIPTDELLRILYTRMNGEVGTGGAPPEYSSS
uniref:Glycoside hydrolase family 76 protein n=1 Tax=Mycena chlorophos TaxID=658473 RepID=A0ABQ0LJX7_MYCCL|nr:glycoside hydrolase family 76 protein [Mycena chlorophos]